MASPAASLERIARICASAADARGLRLDLLAEIRQVVGFDAYAWLLTDPHTCVGASPLADVPCLPELPELIRLKYLIEVNRWTALTGPPAVTLQQATGGEPARSLLWRGLLHRYAIGDVASVVFRDRFGCWSFLDLWRPGASARFTPEETAYLSALAAPVTRGLRRAQASAFIPRAGTASAAAGGAVPAASGAASGPVVLLLGPGLRVLRQTPQTQEYLRVLVPPEGGRPPIPASAYNVAGQLVATEAGVDENPPWARVHMSGGLWLTLRAARIGAAPAGQAGEPDIAVTIEETSAADRTALFALAFGLSARERDLLGHLVTGLPTRDIAARMFISEHTVTDHLKSISAKTGTHTRGALLARALGT
jgi:DNA-binding CsgD family transcriptional regulator